MKLARKILFAILLCVFVFFLVQTVFAVYTRYVARDDYVESKDIANLPEITSSRETTSAPETTMESEEDMIPDVTTTATPPAPIVDETANTLLLETDIAALKAVNPDVIGWIIIPKTNISFPLLQGEDNEQYLRHTWLGKWSWSGSIFLDCHIESDFSDFNSIIYGHNMGGGDMFSDLLLYKEQDFYNNHPSVYIVTEGRIRRYDIFSAYESNVENDKTYTINLSSAEKEREYVDRCKKKSVISCDDPRGGVGIITLSTCPKSNNNDYKTRWVVQASLGYEATIEEILLAEG